MKITNVKQRSPSDLSQQNQAPLSPNGLSLSEKMATLSVEMERLNNESHKKDSDLETWRQRANFLESMVEDANHKVREYERILGEVHGQLQTCKKKQKEIK